MPAPPNALSAAPSAELRPTETPPPPEALAISPRIEAGSGVGIEAWGEGETRHERALMGNHRAAATKRQGPFGQELARRLEEKRKLASELGYPSYDPKFDDPAWLKEQFQREKDDPRENANFFLGPDDPEFMHNLARKPYAKAMLRSEEHWNHRRRTWMEQHARVEYLNGQREQIALELEDCSGELKRMVTPMLKYKVMEVFLASVLGSARELGMGFEDLLSEDETRGTLLSLHQQLHVEGTSGANAILAEVEEIARRNAAVDAAKEKELRAIPDQKALAVAMTMAGKCKKDGLLEWEAGNHAEALTSWREGSVALKRLGGSEEFRRQHPALRELHSALLRNQAQAAIKVGNWTEAVQAAESALKMDDEDHKAWFRKACALEGLGKLDEVEGCLARIDAIAVGRPDQQRLQRDTEAKREKLQALRSREEAVQRRMFQRGTHQGLFSVDRDRPTPTAEALPPGPPALSSNVKPPARTAESERKRVTREGAAALLQELRKVYSEPGFRKSVRKLAKDVREDKGEFICYLSKVALSVQRPVLERWGFEASERGVGEMTRAIQDHTRGRGADAALRATADETVRALYGPMYERIHGAAAPQPVDVAAGPQVRVELRGRKRWGGEAESGSETSSSHG